MRFPASPGGAARVAGPGRSARPLVTGQVSRVGDVDRVAVHAERVAQDAAHQVLGHQAVLARLRRGGNGDRVARILLLDRHVIAVRLERGGKGHRPFGKVHFFSTTGTAVPDHSPKIRTTMEIAAFLAPATMTGICRGPDRIRWTSSSPAKVPSGLRGTFPLPASRNSRPVRPH